MIELDEPKIAEEISQKAAPLSSTEKKLIAYSLIIGVLLLGFLVVVTGSYRF